MLRVGSIYAIQQMLARFLQPGSNATSALLPSHQQRGSQTACQSGSGSLGLVSSRLVCLIGVLRSGYYPSRSLRAGGPIQNHVHRERKSDGAGAGENGLSAGTAGYYKTLIRWKEPNVSILCVMRGWRVRTHLISFTVGLSGGADEQAPPGMPQHS